MDDIEKEIIAHKNDDSEIIQYNDIKTLVFIKKKDNTFRIIGATGEPNKAGKNVRVKKIKSLEEAAKRSEEYWTGDTKLCLLRPDRRNYFLDILNDAVANKSPNDNGFIELTCSSKAKYYVHHDTLENLNDNILLYDKCSNTSDYDKLSNVLQSKLELDLLLTRNVKDKQRQILFVHNNYILCRKQIVLSGFLSAFFGKLCDSKSFSANVPNFQEGTFEEKPYYSIPIRHCKFLGYDHLQGTMKNLLGYTSNVIYNSDRSELIDQWEKIVSNAYDKIYHKLVDKQKDCLSDNLIQRIIGLTSGAVFVAAYHRNMTEKLFNKLQWSKEFIEKLKEYVEYATNKYKFDFSVISNQIIEHVINAILEMKNKDAKNKSKKRSILSDKSNDEEDNDNSDDSKKVKS